MTEQTIISNAERFAKTSVPAVLATLQPHLHQVPQFMRASAVQLVEQMYCSMARMAYAAGAKEMLRAAGVDIHSAPVLTTQRLPAPAESTGGE